MKKMRPQVPQHREKSGRELGQEARSAAIMTAIGVSSPVAPNPTPPSQLAAAINAVKG